MGGGTIGDKLETGDRLRQRTTKEFEIPFRSRMMGNNLTTIYNQIHVMMQDQTQPKSPFSSISIALIVKHLVT